MAMGVRKITCIQLDGEFPDFGYRFVMPDYGMPLIGTILSESGYDVKVYMEHIKPPDWDRILESDLICISALTPSANKVYRLVEEIRSRRKIPIVIGGTHATYFTESCLEYCDYAVIGEGDETIIDLVQTLSNGGSLEQVRGLAYRVGDRIIQTAPRPGPTKFDTIPDFSLIQGYHRMTIFDIVRKKRIPILGVQSSRGCPHKCTFCIVNTMFPDGYRKRDIESVIRDLRDKRRYGKTVMFVDNDFTAMRPYTKKLLRRIIEENFGFHISLFARVEIAQDSELLSLMRQAGVSDIFQGFESIQPETLAGYKKRQSLEDIISSVEKLRAFGFDLAASFVLGADSDTRETIYRTIDFALEYPISKPHFFPLWGHYPERLCEYQTIIPRYRSIFRGWGYCDGMFVTHFPLQISPSELQRAIIEGYRIAYSTKRIVEALKRGNFADVKWQLGVRYLWKAMEKGLRNYIPFLEELEDGLYGPDHRLRDAVLLERVRKDPRWTFQDGIQTVEALGLSSLEAADTGMCVSRTH